MLRALQRGWKPLPFKDRAYQIFAAPALAGEGALHAGVWDGPIAGWELESILSQAAGKSARPTRPGTE